MNSATYEYGRAKHSMHLQSPKVKTLASSRASHSIKTNDHITYTNATYPNSENKSNQILHSKQQHKPRIGQNHTVTDYTSINPRSPPINRTICRKTRTKPRTDTNRSNHQRFIQLTLDPQLRIERERR